jgi:alpha-D-xyloside xylohydrolase
MAMLNAWADGTKPWSFPEVENEVRAVAQLRMQLLPYLYTAFARYRDEGIPPFRAMQLVEGVSLNSEIMAGAISSTDNPYAAYSSKEIQYQYMMGDALLVAPMFAGDTTRQVVLPKGKWYDFYTGALVGEHEVIVVKPGLDKIPLFVCDGGIIPMVAARNRMPGPDEKTMLEVRHFGEKESTFLLYDDDGVSFDYERGAFSWSELSAKRSGDEWRGNLKIGNASAFNYHEDITWKFMTK